MSVLRDPKRSGVMVLELVAWDLLDAGANTSRRGEVENIERSLYKYSVYMMQDSEPVPGVAYLRGGKLSIRGLSTCSRPCNDIKAWPTRSKIE